VAKKTVKTKITNKFFKGSKVGWVDLEKFDKETREDIEDWLNAYTLSCVDGNNDFAGYYLLWLKNDFLSKDECEDISGALLKLVDLAKKEGYEHLIFST